MRAPRSPADADLPPDLRGTEPRGNVAVRIVEDLKARGVAVLQGRPGSGISTVAARVMKSWAGSVEYTRPGLFFHLADLLRDLELPPEVVQRESAEGLVEATLERLARGNTLWVLDECDEALEPPPSAALTRDPELGLLFAALDQGALAGTGAVLVVSRRTPRGLSVPSRPLPPLSEDAAQALAGRSVADLEPAWLRRPGALALLGALEGAPPPWSTEPFADLMEAIADRLDDDDAIVLLACAMAVHPVGEGAISAATGLPLETVARACRRLGGLRLMQREGAFRGCRRSVADAARAVLPDRIPALLAEPTLGRLAAWYIRHGSGTGRGWKDVEPARMARFGGRLSARAGFGHMAVTTALYAGHVTVLEQFGAWRHLRDDLEVALARRHEDLTPLDEARARLARARAAEALGDGYTVGWELDRARSPARAAGDNELLLEVMARLGRRILTAGEPAKATAVLEEALSLAHAIGRPAVESELLYMLGGVALTRGDSDKAHRRFERSMEAAERADAPERRAAAEAGLAGVLQLRGELRRAEELLTSAAETAESPATTAARWANVAAVRWERGDLRGVMRATRRGLAAGSGKPRPEAKLMLLRGRLRALAGDVSGATEDLDAARSAVAAGGDRALAAESAALEALLHELNGSWEEAVAAQKRALEAHPSTGDPVTAALARLAALATEARAAAAARAEGDPRAVDRLLKAGRATADPLDTLDEHGSSSRRCEARALGLEIALWGATAAGTAPLGTLRRLESMREEAAADPERFDHGEPVFTWLLAWAQHLCRRSEDASATARTAARKAGLATLSTVRGGALVLAGEAAAPWNGPALVLARLLGSSDGRHGGA